jgi:hypothetical protein
MHDSIAERRTGAASTPRRRLSIAVTAVIAAVIAWTGMRALAAQNAPAPGDRSSTDKPPVAAAINAPPDDLPGALSTPAPPRASRASRAIGENGENTTTRLREGSQIANVLGQFRQEGERFSFIDESGRTFGGLPNLSLERIANALKSVEEPESVWWSVSGTITEFNEGNYLLITRAVFKATALPPAPERIEQGRGE